MPPPLTVRQLIDLLYDFNQDLLVGYETAYGPVPNIFTVNLVTYEQVIQADGGQTVTQDMVELS